MFPENCPPDISFTSIHFFFTNFGTAELFCVLDFLQFSVFIILVLNSFNVSYFCPGGITICSTFPEFTSGPDFGFTILFEISFSMNFLITSTAL